MKALPFGNYRPDENNGTAFAADYSCKDAAGKTLLRYVAVYMDCDCRHTRTDDGYMTLMEAEAAAYLQARQTNAVFVPSSKGGTR